MSESANSQTQSDSGSESASRSEYDPRANAWLKPEQVDAMRSATVANSASYLAARNDALLALLYDTGLRVGEFAALDVSMLDLDEGIVMLPGNLQKDYPTERSPQYVEIELSPEVVRTLRMYLASRWKDSIAVFPSRQSDRMTNQSVRNVVRTAAEAAEVRPFSVNGRSEPTEVTPHTLRHSVAYRMLNREKGNTLYDVTKRLRHATIQTTERVYSHFDRV